MNIFFLKSGNLIRKWPLLSYATYYTERLSSPSKKIGRQGDFKNSNTIFKIDSSLVNCDWKKIESVAYIHVCSISDRTQENQVLILSLFSCSPLFFIFSGLS